MSRRLLSFVIPLVFVSGFCSLVYQIAWLRDFRLIFGASTAASAAVVAVFIGGLGAGGLILGRRCETHPQPLRMYSHLELAIATSSAVTPALLWLARQAYIGLGGSIVLGLGLGSVLRLLLTALVLFVPTFLMGGTLPVLARSVVSRADVGRRSVALIYGANTLGALTGCVAANFVMLEVFGSRSTLWLACLLNGLLGMAARVLARQSPSQLAPKEEPTTAFSEPPTPPSSRFVLVAAAVVGFAFFFMELVWYRMLGPLLGGTVFTFGLILAVALFGIAIGGASYALFDRNRHATLGAFAITCLLEAAFLAIPFALGDRLALLALQLRPLGVFGFGGVVVSWAVVTFLVVFPAAFLAGLQFPLLISLLGLGPKKVGYQTGLAYAWNTAGAIAGSLAGGFGLLPLLTAPGSWRAVVVLLVVLGLVAFALQFRRTRKASRAIVPVGLAAGSLILIGSLGPTAVWRHSPIGVGRVPVQKTGEPNALRATLHDARRAILWEAEGVESSVALHHSNGYAMILNGKNDGAALDDAPTAMSGLVGAIVHPNPTSSLVIGLGTGSTAGWLGVVPTMQRVDVIELEPSVREIARACSPVNRDVHSNPKVHVLIGDAREALLTTPVHYDLIFSEPSNPYRAGIASLFTQEYYEAVRGRLAPGGLFSQWVQAYEVDAPTIRSVVATVATVFPVVEVWQLRHGDLMLVASMEPRTYHLPTLRARVNEEPYRTALAVSWRVVGLEGFLARHIARPSLAQAILREHSGLVSTDDRNVVEFGFARGLGSRGLFSANDLLKVSIARGEDLPEVEGGVLTRTGIADGRFTITTREGLAPVLGDHLSPSERQRGLAHQLYATGKPKGALKAWRSQPRAPLHSIELSMVSTLLAKEGSDEALELLDELRKTHPAEADAILAALHHQKNDLEASTEALAKAFVHHRTDPWSSPLVLGPALQIAEVIVRKDRSFGPRLLVALDEPFAVHLLEDARNLARVSIARMVGIGARCVDVLAPLEPFVPWKEPVLRYRNACYRAVSHPNASQASSELEDFLFNKAAPFSSGLLP